VVRAERSLGENLAANGSGDWQLTARRHTPAMDDQRLGAAVRLVRTRRGWRQIDLANAAGVSRSTVSRIERGHFGSVSVDAIRAVAAALDIRIELRARWRAGDLDRLLNARHSALHELVARYFADLPGWILEPEVSFAIFGERGIVDILAWHPGRRALLVIELKTDIADVNELVGTVDRKRRLAVAVARERGWDVGPDVTTSVWVIVASGRTNRRRVHAHRTMLRAAFPLDGRAIGRWLRDPVEAVRCLSFWPDAHGQNVGHGGVPVRRVAKGPARPPRARSRRPAA
jgi:transcriptional regulator with XRE-family HTH domain